MAEPEFHRDASERPTTVIVCLAFNLTAFSLQFRKFVRNMTGIPRTGSAPVGRLHDNRGDNIATGVSSALGAKHDLRDLCLDGCRCDSRFVRVSNCRGRQEAVLPIGRFQSGRRANRCSSQGKFGSDPWGADISLIFGMWRILMHLKAQQPGLFPPR